MEDRNQVARPAYREALQAIGHYFDQQAYRGIFVAEVDEGYIGKARSAYEEAELHAEGFSFPLDDVQALIASPITTSSAAVDGPPHCPYGYGLFMQAVGEFCDRNDACYVSVLEVSSGFVLCYTSNCGPRRRGGKGAPKAERRRFVLDRTGIEEMINHASA
jgi:hypothetical protein